MQTSSKIAVLGAGLAGSMAALEMANAGHEVHLIDRAPRPMLGASRHNEGKLHLGYVYGADRSQQTHRILASGSLTFLDTVQRVTGAPRELLTTSDPFTYIVPRDSMKPVDEFKCRQFKCQGLHDTYGVIFSPLVKLFRIRF